MNDAVNWPDAIFDTLKSGRIVQVGYVPDAGHARLIERCRADPGIRDVVLTTEEEGVALAAGAWLGGQRAALLMQSSGVGNCINMLSLPRNCRFPLLMLVTMRGEWGEFNPWQVPMGSTTEAALRLCACWSIARSRRGGRRRRCGGARSRLRRAAGHGGAAVATPHRPQALVNGNARPPRRR